MKTPEKLRLAVASVLIGSAGYPLFCNSRIENSAEAFRSVSGGGLGKANSTAEVSLGILHVTGQSLGSGGLATEAGAPATIVTDDSIEIGDTTGLYTDAMSPTYYLADLIWPGRPHVDAGNNVLIGNNYFPQNRLGAGSDYRAVRLAKKLFASQGLQGMRWASVNTSAGGQVIACIKPDSGNTTISPNGNPCNSFQSAIDQVAAYVSNPAVDAGLPVRVVAGVDVHGEADCASDQYVFRDQTLDMFARYQSLDQALTHQTKPIPWIVTQQHSRCINAWYNESNYAQWMMAMKTFGCGPAIGNPLCVVTTGTYWYETVDGTHHSDLGYEQLGAWVAKWLTKFERWQNGGPWQETLVPTAFSYNAGTFTLTITFNVPAGSLVFDTSHGEPHQAGQQWGAYWANCHGFETWNGNPNIPGIFAGDAAGPPTIVGCTSATIVGNTVVIVGAASFTHVGYAMTPDILAGSCIGGASGHTGAVCGSVGSLRDTDPTVDSISGQTIPDWAASIPYIPVTWSGPTCWDGGC